MKFSVSFVALTVPPNFTLWSPARVRDVHLDADVRQLAILRHACPADRRTDRRSACTSACPGGRSAFAVNSTFEPMTRE